MRGDVRPEPLEPFVEPAAEASAEELVTRFSAEARAVGAHVHRAADESDTAALVARVCAEAGVVEVALSGSPLVAGLADALAAVGLRTFRVTDFTPRERDELIRRLERCGAGVTAADYAIAETGTLVLTGDEEGALLASLLPAVHVALLRPRQISESLAEVVSRLKRERMGRDRQEPVCRSATFVTGPSRTSDVELVLSIGVRGPKQLHVVIVGQSGNMKESNPSLTNTRVTRRSFLKTTSAAVVAGAVVGSLPESLTAGAARRGEATGSGAVGHGERLLKGWEYRRGNLGGPWELWRKASDDTVTWQPVELPHCFNATDAVDPDAPYYQGPGWYRTRLKVENPYPRGRTLLHFEGAGQKTEVYVGTKRVGAHVGGYDEWTVDITDEAEAELKKPDGKGLVPVAVLCDNSRDLEMIPSNLSDFNLYGGLYRYVSLVYAPAISLERVLAESTPPPRGKATVSVRARLYNPGALEDEVRVEVRVLDPRGKTVHSGSQTLAPWAGGRELAAFVIDTPALWSPQSPSLYRCVVTLKSAHGESRVAERFGLRSFEFVKQGPFKLNGERLLLRGTHRHEDHAGLAAALTEELIRKEFALAREMGVNFMRLGHYQQSRIALELCDELGILVWEEIPWCRGGLGGERYKEQARRMLRNMIDQHRNSPSVIIWGLGNENDWPGDFEEFDKEKIRAFMKELHELSHQLDPTRKTAIRRCDFCKDIVDVYSPSIWAGWYRGRYTEYKSSSETEMKKVNHFLHVEYGGDSHARRHSENPDQILSKIATGQGTDERGLDYLRTGGVTRASSDGDWSETYICNLFDWHLKEQETMPWLTGAAQWIFKDFSTPLRPGNPVPRVNQKGVVERDLTIKEAYYVFQSYWAEKPMVRVYGHSWPVRWGQRGEAKMVKVYSNCAEVELFHNGVSLGVRRRDSQDFPAAGLRWQVKFVEGPNRLRAVGRRGGAQVSDEIVQLYETRAWGKPARLALEEVGREGDILTVEVRAFDANGVPCLDSRAVVRFGLTGDGRLLDNLGTSTGARKLELYNGRARISAALKGPAVVSVSSEGLPTALLKAEARP